MCMHIIVGEVQSGNGDRLGGQSKIGKLTDSEWSSCKILNFFSMINQRFKVR